MYGGVINDQVGPNTVNSDQVYILSIPAFQWFQAVYPPAFSRALHTCHTTNNNQMIVIGGVDPTNDDTTWVGSADNGAEPRDPWAEGIGIFDMTTLKFKDSYESKAKPYEPPEVIQSFYKDKSAELLNSDLFFRGTEILMQEQTLPSDMGLIGCSRAFSDGIQIRSSPKYYQFSSSEAGQFINSPF